MSDQVAGLGDLTILAPGVTVSVTHQAQAGDEGEDSDFGANLALTLSPDRLSALANDLLSQVQVDDQSRQAWLDTRKKGLKLLGLTLEEPRGDVGSSTAPLEGMSTITSPLLLSEVLRAQATARGELLPATGPVKVVNESVNEGVAQDELAQALEKDLNVYLTKVCTEYYPDTDRMLFYTVFGGVGFKKVYHCPVRRRPVSESVDASDLIVNASATDLRNAQRITHVIRMTPGMVKRMMLIGAYRHVNLTPAVTDPDQVQQVKAQIEGVDVYQQWYEGQDRTLYEICCELDLGEHPEALPLPYRVTIDKDARVVLDVRRHWQNGDHPLYQAKQLYVRFPYVDAIGLYGIGLLHILGNSTKALTAAEREILDAGMFASFPGFLYSEAVARQDTNDFRVPPGGGVKINTGGRPIGEVISKLPYEGPSPTLLAFAQWLTEAGKSLAGSAELPVGEGQANVPVGTMLAMVEQATVPMSAVHKRLHAAQAEEFELLRRLLIEDPEAFYEHGRSVYDWSREVLLEALGSLNLTPVADPNEPSRTHRLMKAQAIKTLSGLSPQLYDVRAVDTYVLRLIGVSDPSSLFTTQQPGPQPMELMLQQKQQEAQLEAQTRQQDAAAKLKAAEIRAQTDEKEAQLKAQTDQAQLDLDRRKLGAELATDAFKGLHDHARQSQLPSP